VASRISNARVVPDRLDEAALAAQLQMRLRGAPADGSSVSLADAQRVVWVDAGDEVLVHLDSIQVRLLNRIIVVSVDLETDQTGRAPLICSLALGGQRDKAGLIATTDEIPHGNPQLAARWGRVLQSALWGSLLALARDHAAERGEDAQALHVMPGRLQLETARLPRITLPARPKS
jgi:hypothetical protein